ncbi:MAG: FG-GAP repeat domain-containing protein, partial [bacterium]
MPRHLKTENVAALAAFAATASAFGQQFVDQTSTRFPVQSEYTNQCTFVDIDGDGDKDIVFANGQGYSSLGALLKPRIYVNNGTGFFTDETDARAAGITGCFRGVEAGDVDRDGDWDLLVAQDFNRRPLLLVNNGAGVFADQTTTRLPNITMGSARGQFGDVDNDGDLDIVLCNSGTNRFSATGRPRLFINGGAGVFTDAPTTQFPTTALAEQMDCVFGDVDNDLDL